MNRTTALLVSLLAAACSRPAQPPSASSTARTVSGTPAVLAHLPEEAAPAAPANAPATGFGLHPAAGATTPEFLFSELGGGVAWADNRDGKARVFHNGCPGRAYDAVGQIALSLDGRRCAYGALRNGTWRLVLDGEEGAPFSVVQNPVFSPDGLHVAYQAMSGERWHVVVDEKANAGTAARYSEHLFSGDSSRIAFVEDDAELGQGRLVITDLEFGGPVTVEERVAALIANPARTRIAAITDRGAQQQVITVAFDSRSVSPVGPPWENVFGLAFGPDGAALTYRAIRDGKSYVTLNDSMAIQPPGGVVSQEIEPGGKALGAIIHNASGVRFQRFFGAPVPEAPVFDEVEGLVYSADGRCHAYVARSGEGWSLVVNGKAGPIFDRSVTPQFSPDGKRVVYRARQDGKRFVVVADTEGKTVRQHPAYEQVFPVQFTADGKSVAYGVKDGRQLAWKVEPL